MDAITGAVLGVAVGGAIGLLARTLNLWSQIQKVRLDNELEAAKLKSNWYNQMQMKKLEKKSKKESSEQEDDEPDDDDLLRAVRHPMVRGFLDGFGVDADKLAGGSATEWQKLKGLGDKLQQQHGEVVVG